MLTLIQLEKIIQFEKTGAAKYISHLDLQRAVQRAIRRAGLPIAYTQGFNPHMQISYATALSLGFESICELMAITLTGEIPPEKISADLNATLPSGLLVRGCKTARENSPSLSSAITASEYAVTVFADQQETLAKVNAFASAEECVIAKRSKKGVKNVNIRPLVYNISCENGIIKTTLEHMAQSSLNPDLLMSAIGIIGGYQVMRTALFADDNGNLVNIWEGVL